MLLSHGFKRRPAEVRGVNTANVAPLLPEAERRPIKQYRRVQRQHRRTAPVADSSDVDAEDDPCAGDEEFGAGEDPGVDDQPAGPHISEWQKRQERVAALQQAQRSTLIELAIASAAAASERRTRVRQLIVEGLQDRVNAAAKCSHGCASVICSRFETAVAKLESHGCRSWLRPLSRTGSFTCAIPSCQILTNQRYFFPNSTVSAFVQQDGWQLAQQDKGPCSDSAAAEVSWDM